MLGDRGGCEDMADGDGALSTKEEKIEEGDNTGILWK